MKRYRNLFNIDKIPGLFLKIIILCLGIYLFVNTYSMFDLPDLKGIIKNSGKKMSETIASETLMNYLPIIGYVMNEDEEKEEESWQKRLIKATTANLPVYQYMDKQYILALDKTDPSYMNNLVSFNGGGNDEGTDGNEGESTEANANIIVPMPELVGPQYSIEQLSDFDFLVSNFYSISESTVVYNSDLDASKLMTKDLKMVQDNSKPQILIYHTHSQEYFTDTVEGDPSTTIVGVGTYLAEVLSKQFGYNVIHDTTSYDLVDGVLDRNKAYDYADRAIPQILADNPSIEVILDIHRDGVNEGMHLVTEINGKQTAKIMFFNGISRLKDIGDISYLHNPNQQDNFAMSMQMKMLAMAYYPDFTRKNFIKPYQYNLDLMPKAMLIEVGAQTNSLQEAKNAMEPLAVLLNKVLN